MRLRVAHGRLAWVLGCAGAGAVAAAHAEAAIPPGSQAARIDASLLELRVALAAIGLVLFVAGWLRRRRGRPESRGSARRALLVATAALAFATNYNLFVWTGLHRHELYHYYLGSKYFPELGYTRLYVCSVEAVFGSGPLPATLTEITDLSTKRRLAAAAALEGAAPCRTDFSAARWDGFRADVAAFRAWMGDEGWRGVLRDHGYNPAPAWTLVGRPLASLVPPTPGGLWLLARIDLLLLLGAFAAVGATFGLEAMCVAAIAWGACGHTRYQWTGDAFLRQLWLASTLGALCLLRRGWHAAAGALLAFATLERVFPGAFFLGYGLREAFHWVRSRAPTAGFGRFVLGAALATVLVVGVATGIAGRGPGVWGEFAANTRAMLSFTPRNALGLSYALSFTTVRPAGLEGSAEQREAVIQRYRRETLAARAVPRGLLLAAFAVLFVGAAWRGARGPTPSLTDWEAAAMGAAVIPFATMPGSYYIGFILAGALLATRRPRIGIGLLLAVLGFASAQVVYGTRALAYAWSSWILLAWSLWMFVELWLPAEEDRPRLSAGP